MTAVKTPWKTFATGLEDANLKEPQVRAAAIWFTLRAAPRSTRVVRNGKIETLEFMALYGLVGQKEAIRLHDGCFGGSGLYALLGLTLGLKCG